MCKLVNFGYDPGRFQLKAYTKKDKFSILNVVCDGYDIRTLKNEQEDLIDLLDVEIIRNKKSYGRFFVGVRAYEYNNGDLRWTTRMMPKFSEADKAPDEIVKLLTTVAFGVHKVGEKTVERIRLGTGSATEDYFENPQIFEDFKKILKDDYTVRFLHPLFKGAEVEIHFDEVYFKPEGTATAFSIQYNDDLTPNIKIKEILDSGMKVFVFNMGSSTGDAAYIKSNGEFDKKGFFGVPVGVNDALKKVQNTLKTSYGYDVNNFKLNHLLQNYTKVKYKGQTIDLNEIKKQPYESTYHLLRNNFFSKCEEKNIDLGEAGALVLAGGGALDFNHMYADKIKDFIPGVSTMISNDPLYEDARGYYLECLFMEIEELEKKNKIFSSNPNIQEESNKSDEAIYVEE